jgi:hypothetical protein
LVEPIPSTLASAAPASLARRLPELRRSRFLDTELTQSDMILTRRAWRHEIILIRVHVLDGEIINLRLESPGAISFHWPEN